PGPGGDPPAAHRRDRPRPQRAFGRRADRREERPPVSLSIAELCATAFGRGLAPEPDLAVSEWADQYRFLSSTASAEPGQWRTARTPYLRAIMDCLSPHHPAERVVFVKGAQLGGTECGSNWIGYVIHHAPGPMLMVQPTVENAKRVSKQRIAPMIE